jgi:hypothetical protein
MLVAFFRRFASPRIRAAASRPLIERIEDRCLMSVSAASTIGIGPPPRNSALGATVVALSPLQTETGTPQVSVTVVIPDTAPSSSISLNFVKIEHIYVSS